MTFEKITENVENISLLADNPAMTSTELKAEFDKGNKVIKQKFNKLVDDLNAIGPFEGIKLYEDPTGTTGNITSSQSITSMKRIRITGYINEPTEKYYFEQTFPAIKGKVGLIFKGRTGTQYAYFCHEVLTLEDASIIRGSHFKYGLGPTLSIVTEPVQIYITSVEGLNY